MGGKWGSGEIGCGLSCMIGGKWGSGEEDGRGGPVVVEGVLVNKYGIGVVILGNESVGNNGAYEVNIVLVVVVVGKCGNAVEK